MAGVTSGDGESVCWVSSPVGKTRCLYLRDARWMQPLPITQNFPTVPEESMCRNWGDAEEVDLV